MQNDRQRALLWALGVGVGVVLFVAGTWRLATFDQTWRAIVRVKVEKSLENWTNRPFNPYFLQEKFESASNTFTDSVFRRELEKATGTQAVRFRFLGAEQYRSTSIIELKFVGRTEAEVKLLGEKAVQLWLDQLMTNAPADPGKFLETYTLTSAQDQRNSFRQWTWRHFGF
jgi:hypothetical protein